MRGCKKLPPGVRNGDCQLEKQTDVFYELKERQNSNSFSSYDFTRRYGESCYCVSDLCNKGVPATPVTTFVTNITSSNNPNGNRPGAGGSNNGGQNGIGTQSNVISKIQSKTVIIHDHYF